MLAVVCAYSTGMCVLGNSVTPCMLKGRHSRQQNGKGIWRWQAGGTSVRIQGKLQRRRQVTAYTTTREPGGRQNPEGYPGMAEV